MKEILAVIFLLSLHSEGLHGLRQNGKLFHRYAKMKILEQCYGPELLKEWQDWMSGRVAECRATRATRSADDDSREMDSVEDMHAAMLTPDQLAALKKKKERKMSMLNCVLDAMNVTTTAEGSVDTAPIVSYIKKAKMDADLMNDLVGRIEQCGKMRAGKSCRPSASPADPAFAAKMAFMQCEMRARLQACVVRDMNKNKDMFKLGAFEDMFSGHHRYDDLDDIYDVEDDDDDDDDRV